MLSNSNYTGQKHFFAARYLYEILFENEFNLEDPHFTSVWNCMKSFNENFITVAQHLDFFLHSELEDVIEKYVGTRLTVLWRDDFPDFDEGDYLEEQRIVAKCSFTIWLYDEK